MVDSKRTTRTPRSLTDALIVALVLLAPAVGLFGTTLFSPTTWVYRDAAHYYYPLYQFVNSQWAAGHIPLWNTLDGLGQPLAADATCAAFYPGKIVFLLPLAFATCFKLYVVGHVILAAANAYGLARGLRLSRPAACLSSIAFAYSGVVVFQVCNVVFLVGAAWLPLSLLAAERIITRRRFVWVITLAVSLAMMVLGGDPQMDYHVGLMALLGIFALRRRARSTGSPVAQGSATQPKTGNVRRLTNAVASVIAKPSGLLAVAALIGGLLAAVQILPSHSWSRHSRRAASDHARNVYELSLGDNQGDFSRGTLDNVLVHPDRADGHLIGAYQFSVGPWQWIEMVWPNVTGEVYPVNRRWLRVVPAEGRTWVPSLYFGLLPLLLAAGSLSWRRKRRNHCRECRIHYPVWFTWMATFALVASLGWYSLGWVASELYHGIAGPDAAEFPAGGAVGGLYWLCQQLLPGYVMFRYPAKWMTLFALAAAVLAGFGLDRWKAGQYPKLPLVCLAVSMLSLVLAALVATLAWATPIWDRWLVDVSPDGLFGPLDTQGAARAAIIATLHTMVVAAILSRLAACCKARQPSREQGLRPASTRFRPVAIYAALAVCVIELTIAHRNLLPTAPISQWEKPSPTATAVHSAVSTGPRNVPPRAMRPKAWIPENWADTSSAQRQVVGQKWDHDTLLPRYHLQANVNLIDSTASIDSLELLTVLDVLRRPPYFGGETRPQLSPELLDVLGVGSLVVPADAPPEVFGADQQRPIRGVKNVQLLVNGNTQPRAWVVSRVRVVPPPASQGPRDLAAHASELLYGLDTVLHHQTLATVEVDPLRTFPFVSEESIVGGEAAILQYQPQQVTIAANLDQPGLLILSDLFYPGWEATVTDVATGEKSSAEILRTNRVMRGIWLQAGTYEVAYDYRPREFYWGAVISIFAWLAVAAAMSLTAWRRLRGR